ncbi:MAG: AAA family ATPase [Clostridium sp.]|jgi:predicted ATP-dependent protease|uniref:AAA family ATPase n=1 Tax=Clostridium sp. TaxID=1506 RepID=UPI0025C43E92|nr:AAA family ATPase [Clostridium sp.]MCH3964198.1 AAA family ATPase [Clostridium sp.]MCI1715379.1 AAA family ATPase [Clostridium sp.]MCI1799830.1 AAA family ATPase [Clostridium sp.]MCI1813562.1 AAA family ATPase [Clostridium sp.]MCI1870648.1 AAA family ATPase [Clostridium sp.]
MKRELKPEEIIYDFDMKDIDLESRIDDNIEYGDVYRKIKMAFNIDREGYNLYIVDDFSKDKLEDIENFIRDNIGDGKVQDICYVIYDDVKNPKALFLKSGYGRKLENMVKKIKTLYFKITFEFYNGSNKEKEFIVESINSKKSNLIDGLLNEAKKKNFTLKPTEDGFVFIPLKENGKVMSEEEYALLGLDEKQDIINNVGILKNSSQEILDNLKDMEMTETEKIKLIMDNYYNKMTSSIKKEYSEIFKGNESVLKFLDNMCSSIEKDIRKIYSINYEDDEKSIKNIIFKYSVNVLVDNSGREKPPVIYEEDPSVTSLMGNIEYENKDGNYVTDISLIRAGSILKANGGCLILTMSSLLNNQNSYYYLKKSLLSGQVKLDYKKGYLELLSLNGLNPQPIDIDEKVIIIGDYNTYNFLYNYDSDFKKVFRIRAEYNSILDIDDNIKMSFLKKIIQMCKNKNLKPVTDEGLREIAKFLSRKAENRNKLLADEYELEKLLVIADGSSRENGGAYIEAGDIENAAYSRELAEQQIDEGYRQNQIFIDVEDKKIGQVNALSILNTGYFTFGKPMRLTCSCTGGNGDIIDVQRESNLSGKIHNKAINTIKGYINNLIGGYVKLPVNFHISFEQLYGSIDGDSASVAEAVSIISSISKIGIRQNIAVTGSINQFGEVQPVGGINEKIEGFFNICNIIGNTKGKGVLIPESNIISLALKNEVEEEINRGNFHIYSMTTVEDAVEILMGEDNIRYEDVINSIRRECKKYYGKQEKRSRHS